MTTIYLIRHGENDWIGRRLPGWRRDVHLNERGLAQAAALAEVLRAARLEAVYSSPLPRAVETARPLARAVRLPIRRRARLGEIHVGTWEGQPLGRLRRTRLWSVIQNAPSQARFPDGESFVEAQARIAAELEAIRLAHPSRRSRVACFSHGDVIKVAVAHILGLSLDLFQRIAVAPASITIVHLEPGGGFVVRVNDTRAADLAAAG